MEGDGTGDGNAGTEVEIDDDGIGSTAVGREGEAAGDEGRAAGKDGCGIAVPGVRENPVDADDADGEADGVAAPWFLQPAKARTMSIAMEITST